MRVVQERSLDSVYARAERLEMLSKKVLPEDFITGNVSAGLGFRTRRVETTQSGSGLNATRSLY